MALTPAQKHQLRVRAQQSSAQAAGDTLVGASTYELQLLQLKQDQSRLSGIQSMAARAEIKLQLLPNYEPYVQGVLSADQAVNDEVLATVMVWYFDCGQFEQGLNLGEHILKHNLVMPDRFNRKAAVIIAEEVANAGKDGGVPFAVLSRTEQLTQAHDMPDEVRAKLYLAMGRSLGEPDETTALETLQQQQRFYSQAIELHERVGAKKLLEAVERFIKKHAESLSANS